MTEVSYKLGTHHSSIRNSMSEVVKMIVESFESAGISDRIKIKIGDSIRGCEQTYGFRITRVEGGKIFATVQPTREGFRAKIVLIVPNQKTHEYFYRLALQGFYPPII